MTTPTTFSNAPKRIAILIFLTATVTLLYSRVGIDSAAVWSVPKFVKEKFTGLESLYETNALAPLTEDVFKKEETTDALQGIKLLKDDGKGFQKSKEDQEEDHNVSGLCRISLNLSPCSCNRTIKVKLDSCPNADTPLIDVLRKVKEAYGESNCGDWATLRGGGQRVVSYTVYGDFPTEYHLAMSELVPRVPQAYPGWVMRIHHNLDLNNDTIQKWYCSFACGYNHVDFCNVKKLPGLGNVLRTAGSVWRFAVMGDPVVDRYLIRDADMPLYDREVAAVNEWLQKGTCYHVMRDNPAHTVTMMAGMWAGCNSWRVKEVKTIRDKIFNTARRHYQDQTGIRSFLWPMAKNNATAHDSYFCQRFGPALPFPTQRFNNTFIGSRIYRKAFRKDRVRTKCPLACRPKDHKDWELC